MMEYPTVNQRIVFKMPATHRFWYKTLDSVHVLRITKSAAGELVQATVERVCGSCAWVKTSHGSHIFINLADTNFRIIQGKEET